MRNRMLIAAMLFACPLAAGSGFSATAQAAPYGFSFARTGENAGGMVIKVKKRRARRYRLRRPISPSYLAYDYPYYFSRGHYPTHIGPGYIYYGVPYLGHYRGHGRYRSSCNSRRRSCAEYGF